ncbi:MAG TPA: heme ABC exporter ATP-binding protein CcmA [Longimicrobiales bacterium]|nr:heme ABC exporter ATP-binding protein CcmA [Longimicrobiales bacterium]
MTSSGAADGVVAEGIAKRFGHRWALRGLDLRARPGAVLGLLGANGSGKSTLLRILGTTLGPTRGGGRIFGLDLRADRAGIRSLVGAMYHAPGVYGDLTARENLLFATRMWGLDAGGIDGALDRVGLTAVADEPAAGFSSGMTRRLALARLILRPGRLLLLDEPYASFDADGVDLVNEVVRETTARDGVVLIATHNPEKASAVVDEVVRLENGRTADIPTAPPALTGAAGAAG